MASEVMPLFLQGVFANDHKTPKSLEIYKLHEIPYENCINLLDSFDYV